MAYLKAMESKVKGLIEERAADLQRFMKDAAELLDEAGEVLATWKTSKAGTKFDLESFKADHPELYAKYVRDSEPKRPFLLKVKAECPQLPLIALPRIDTSPTDTVTMTPKIAALPSAPVESAASVPSPNSKGSKRKSKVA